MVNVPDLESAVKFYTTGLNFQVRSRGGLIGWIDRWVFVEEDGDNGLFVSFDGTRHPQNRSTHAPPTTHAHRSYGRAR